MPDRVRAMVKASLYLPADLVDRVRRLARLQDRSQTAVLRRAIEAGVQIEEDSTTPCQAVS